MSFETGGPLIERPAMEQGWSRSLYAEAVVFTAACEDRRVCSVRFVLLLHANPR